MGDTTMREAVLWEFTYDAGVQRLCRVADMADEIRHLRDENTALSAEMDRLRRILAALREPSEALVEAVAKAQEPRWWPMLSASVRALRRQSANRILRAGVAAAEQEVERE